MERNEIRADLRGKASPSQVQIELASLGKRSQLGYSQVVISSSRPCPSGFDAKHRASRSLGKGWGVRIWTVGCGRNTEDAKDVLGKAGFKKVK